MVARPELDGYEPEADEPEAEPDHGHFVLAFYELDRAYGGSEEGGWWYDMGELQRVWRVCKSREKAYALARHANDWLARLNRIRRRSRGGYRADLGSVCYSGGAYGCYVFEGTAPASFPQRRPYYE